MSVQFTSCVYWAAIIKLSKIVLSKIVQSGGFLGKRLVPLLETGLPLMKNVLKPLAKGVLLSASASSGSGRPSDLAQRTTTMIMKKWKIS